MQGKSVSVQGTDAGVLAMYTAGAGETERFVGKASKHSEWHAHKCAMSLVKCNGVGAVSCITPVTLEHVRVTLPSGSINFKIRSEAPGTM